MWAKTFLGLMSFISSACLYVTLFDCGMTVLTFDLEHNIKCILQPVAAIKWAGPVSFEIAPTAFMERL